MRTLFVSCFIACLPGLSFAQDWTLSSDASSVGFVSIKNGDTAESHMFSGLTGAVSDAGAVEVSIPLANVETFIDIRNERMRDILFKVADFPAATVSTEIVLDDFADLAVGTRRATDVEITVAANDSDASYDAALYVTRISDTAVAVSTARPVIADIRDFNYDDGIEQLREIAGLDAISPAVPVTFDLVFEQ
ncbi:YceI family protein [Aestuariibius insulae]|uniref:YceI family protein n=1 Tax=Aestuariibius insulae TaxID=2058287 RepID=UPI00345EC7DF